jgi:hypothetical protein
MRYAHHQLHTKAYYWGYKRGPRFTTIFRLVNTAIVQHQRSYIKSPHTPKAATNQIPSQAPKAATHPPATLRHTSSRSCAHVSGDAGAWGLTAQLRPNYQGNQSNQKNHAQSSMHCSLARHEVIRLTRLLTPRDAVLFPSKRGVINLISSHDAHTVVKDGMDCKKCVLL